MFLKKKDTYPLYDRNEKMPPLIRDRRTFIISSLLLVVVILLSIRFTGSQMFIEWLFREVGLPLSSGENGMGWHYPNLCLLVLMAAVLFEMNKALNRGMVMAFFIIVLLVSQAPEWIMWLLTNGFGIYKV